MATVPFPYEETKSKYSWIIEIYSLTLSNKLEECKAFESMPLENIEKLHQGLKQVS